MVHRTVRNLRNHEMGVSMIEQNLRRAARGALLLTLLLVVVANIYGRSLERSYSEFIALLPLVALGVAIFTALWVARCFRQHRYCGCRCCNEDANVCGENKGSRDVVKAVMAPYWLQRHHWLWLCTCITFGFVVDYFLIYFPIERMHLFKYSALPVFVLFSLPESWTLQRRLLTTIFLSTVIGALEEVFQLWTPQRVFDLRDLAVNIIASLLGSFIAWLLWSMFHKASGLSISR